MIFFIRDGENTMMKFGSVKETEAFLQQLTSVRDVKQDISYVNISGQSVTVKFLAIGQHTGDIKNIVWMAEEDVDTVQLDYTGADDSITVKKVKITKG